MSSHAFRNRFFGASALLSLLLLGLTPARAGTSLSFDGTNDYVTFGPAPSLGAAAFTVETWFQRKGEGVSTSTGYGGMDAVPLVTKGRAEVDGTNQDMNYFFGIRPSDHVLVADFEEGANAAAPGLNHPLAGVTPLAVGIWYHGAVTYDGTTLRLFLNGVLEAQLAVGQPPRSDSIQHAALGTAMDSQGVPGGYFNGLLDEVRIWNYARLPADLAAGKDSEIASAPGLIGRWGLNEGQGTTATSSAGNGLAGTLVNGPVWAAGFVPGPAAFVIRGPYLQTGTTTSLVVRWRTNTATDSRVRYGTVAGSLTLAADNTTVTTEHVVRLSGLAANTVYYYSIGSVAATMASGADFFFQTAPPVGTEKPTRIWAFGDSGEGTPSAATVRDAYAQYTGTKPTDVWLMLGDNAYENGTDAQYQTGLFDMYTQPLRHTVLWPTIGNHDTDQSATPPASLPYFNIFSLPTAGEAGGVASGTIRYYSFDYATIHFICLDSQCSDRQPGGAMLSWLQRDLASTTQKWIIAYWHHPPYTKGIVDSDFDPNCIDMRKYALPILEAGGADLVLCGHSHSYERSYLLNGHYGFASTFTSSMALNPGSGRADGSGAYRKPAGLSSNQGTVYAIIGCAAEALSGPFNHPAIYTGMARLGSLAIDISGDRLDAHFVRDTGAIDDYFTIRKNLGNQLPAVALTSPTQGATFNAPASITVTAAASDADGSIKQVDFYAGNQVIGTRTAAPWSIPWANVPAGTYALSAAATDNLGGLSASAPVTVTVAGAAVPAAPANLTASVTSKRQIDLTWQDNASNESGFKIYRSDDGRSFSKIATLSANSTTYSNGGLAGRRTYYYRVTAFNSAGESAPSNTASATTPK